MTGKNLLPTIEIVAFQAFEYAFYFDIWRKPSEHLYFLQVIELGRTYFITLLVAYFVLTQAAFDHHAHQILIQMKTKSYNQANFSKISVLKYLASCCVIVQ